MGFQLPAAHGLAGFRSADLNHMAAYGMGTKVMVETDNAVHFGAGLPEILGDDGYDLLGDVAETILDGMQYR